PSLISSFNTTLLIFLFYFSAYLQDLHSFPTRRSSDLIQSGTPYQTILSTHTMPGARWFPGATINYTEHIFRNRDLDRTAIIHASEMRKTAEITWGELFRDTAALQQTLKRLGVKKGDRV